MNIANSVLNPIGNLTSFNEKYAKIARIYKLMPIMSPNLLLFGGKLMISEISEELIDSNKPF